MNYQFSKGITVGLVAISVWSCRTSDPDPTPYGGGVYIVNQGIVSDNNGTLSYLSRSSDTIATNIFVQANPELKITGGVQDYTEINGKGLLLVDNATVGLDKVEVVESGTFKTRITLRTPDIENPRRVIQVGLNKAYVSCWDVSGNLSAGTFYKDPGYIAVVDLNSGTVLKKIPAMKGVEAMVMAGSEVFAGSVSNSGDKTLLIINTEINEVKQRIDFSTAPRPIAIDAEGKLWIVVGSEIVRMDIATRVIEKRLNLMGVPTAITISRDKKTFYYSANSRTYKFGINDALASTVVFNRPFSALGADPQTGRLYGSQYPVSTTQAGYILRYEESGVLIDSIKAGIAPSGFYFR